MRHTPVTVARCGHMAYCVHSGRSRTWCLRNCIGINKEIPMAKKITEAKTRAYLKGGTPCPRCGEGPIVGGPVEVAGSEVWQDITCDGCGLRWTDIYVLNRITFEET